MSDCGFRVVTRFVAFPCDAALGLALVNAFFAARWRFGWTALTFSIDAASFDDVDFDSGITTSLIEFLELIE